MRVPPWTLLACLACAPCAASTAAGRAAPGDAQAYDGPTLEDGRPRGLPLDASGREKWDAGWTLMVDNDLLSFSDRDLDYTGGLAVTVAGRRAEEAWFSLDPLVGWVEPLLPPAPRASATPLHAWQAGLLVFTPEDLNNRDPLPRDRPYASLLFVANSRTYVTHPLEPVYEASVVVGMLGLDVAKALQRGIHKGLDLDRVPRGWNHQISEGGEPTFRVVLARQALLASSFQSREREHELKWRAEASVGYLTEASVSVSGRWGLINTPWWSFAPERADYVSQPAPVVGDAVRAGTRELYAWGGVKLRARAYNAFLQGQFRDSAVTIDAGRMERLIGEGWLGVTWQVSARDRLSYVIRYQTAEIEDGPASGDLLWAGVAFSRDL